MHISELGWAVFGICLLRTVSHLINPVCPYSVLTLLFAIFDCAFEKYCCRIEFEIVMIRIWNSTSSCFQLPCPNDLQWIIVCVGFMYPVNVNDPHLVSVRIEQIQSDPHSVFALFRAIFDFDSVKYRSRIEVESYMIHTRNLRAWGGFQLPYL